MTQVSFLIFLLCVLCGEMFFSLVTASVQEVL